MPKVKYNTFMINEIFTSIQGEGFWTGTPTLFIRLSGCNLSCDFCDTQHSEHRIYTRTAIRLHCKNLLAGTAIRHFCITGGEPTIQNIDSLIASLQENFPKFTVQVETNGTRKIKRDPKVWYTCSPKTMIPLENMLEMDEWKLLIGGERTQLAENILQKYSKNYNGRIYLQPIFGGLEKINQGRINLCYAMCLKYNLKLSLQIHKLVGGIK